MLFGFGEGKAVEMLACVLELLGVEREKNKHSLDGLCL